MYTKFYFGNFKACLDYLICRANFVMYEFVMHDFSVYTAMCDFFSPPPLYMRKENGGR